MFSSHSHDGSSTLCGRSTGLWTGVFFFGQFAAPIVLTVLQSQLGGLVVR